MPPDLPSCKAASPSPASSSEVSEALMERDDEAVGAVVVVENDDIPANDGGRGKRGG